MDQLFFGYQNLCEYRHYNHLASIKQVFKLFRRGTASCVLALQLERKQIC